MLEYLANYAQVFLVGGAICVLGQILINTTKMTSARILVLFMLVGVLLETVGVYKYIVEFGMAGATVPICGFGSGLARGAIDGALESGLLGAITGGIQAVSAGIAGVIFLAFVIGLMSSSKTKT
ncbi:MAG: SpoVA/SpoVAEb family sporulation membrane protein [Bacillota bacterium]